MEDAPSPPPSPTRGEGAPSAPPNTARGQGVYSAALVIGAGNIASRVLGLAREQVIAALFGATGPTSAFRTATRVSTAAYDLLLAGALTSALVPVFSDYAAAGRLADLGRIVSTLVNLTLLAMGAIVAVLVIVAPLLVSVLGADPEHFELAVDLTRVALPSILLLGLAGIHTALLQARQRFTAAAFATAVYNLGIIFCALSLPGALSIHSLAVGLILGGGLQILLQLPAWRGLRYSPVIDLRHPGVRLMLRLYTPVFLGMLASYAIVVVDTNLAWRTGPDSVAAMAFATTVIQFPIGLVGAAASLAILPSLSRLAGSEREFGELLVGGMKAVLLLIVPVAAVLVVVRHELIALLFQRAAFDAVATERTALAFLAYAPQLPFVVVDQLLIVAFYARKDTRTPVLVGVVGAAIYLVVALATVQPLGMPGLALANAVQNSAHAVILFALLVRRDGMAAPAALGAFVSRLALAGAVAALAAWAVAQALAGALGPGVAGQVAMLIAGSSAGLLAYVAVLGALRVRELGEARRLVTSRFGA